MLILFFVTIAVLGIYSYALVDPNMTIISHPLWETFRNVMVQLGYHQRYNSWLIYLVLTLILFGFHLFFIHSKKKLDIVRIAILIAVIMAFSYPLLSHDLFNYMFTGKVITHYGDNPYIMKALDYPQDHWTRFMHWTHVTYPYGPVFLPLILIPSFLGFAKFSLSFLLFKAFFGFFYVASVYALKKIDYRSALLFATHPLVLMEGLMNNHNDLVAVGLALLGVYYLTLKKDKIGRLLLLLSGGIKYITLPLVLLTQPQKKHTTGTLLASVGLVAAVAVASYMHGVYPWYFLNIFVLLPYFYTYLKHSYIFAAGLLLSYYPFIALGEWDTERLALKNWIICAAALMNLAYLAYLKRTKKLI